MEVFPSFWIQRTFSHMCVCIASAIRQTKSTKSSITLWIAAFQRKTSIEIDKRLFTAWTLEGAYFVQDMHSMKTDCSASISVCHFFFFPFFARHTTVTLYVPVFSFTARDTVPIMALITCNHISSLTRFFRRSCWRVVHTQVLSTARFKACSVFLRMGCHKRINSLVPHAVETHRTCEGQNVSHSYGLFTQWAG